MRREAVKEMEHMGHRILDLYGVNPDSRRRVEP